MKTKKTLISVFAVIALVAVLVVSCVACQEVKDKANELVDKAKDVVNSLEITTNSNAFLSLYMADNSAVEEDSYVITARFDTDFDVLNKATWALAFSDTSVTENVEEYVTKTLSEDTLSCTVKMLKPFDKVIVLTCANATYSEIAATCQLDCKARLRDNADFYLSAYKGVIPASADQRVIIGEDDGYAYETTKINRMPCFGYSNMGQVRSYMSRVGLKSTIGADLMSERLKLPFTVDREVSVSFLVKPSAELYAAFVTYGLNKASADAVDITSSFASADDISYYSLTTIISSLIDLTKINIFASDLVADDVNDFAKAVYSCRDNDYDGEIILRATTDYETKDYIFKFKFDTSMIPGEDIVGLRLNNYNVAF